MHFSPAAPNVTKPAIGLAYLNALGFIYASVELIGCLIMPCSIVPNVPANMLANEFNYSNTIHGKCCPYMELLAMILFASHRKHKHNKVEIHCKK